MVPPGLQIGRGDAIMVAQIEEEIREKKNRYEKQGESVVSVSRVAPPVPR